jgi:exodeoxyribonuclease III
MSVERLTYKMDFYRAFFAVIDQYRKRGKSIIVCGDFNTAHTEIDIARPKENSIISGFLTEERALLDEFIAMGFIDTFRELHPGERGRYSYWDYKFRSRERNVGWRIDCFFMDRESHSHLKDAFIRDDVTGSDHCPVGITVEF